MDQSINKKPEFKENLKVFLKVIKKNYIFNFYNYISSSSYFNMECKSK